MGQWPLSQVVKASSPLFDVKSSSLARDIGGSKSSLRVGVEYICRSKKYHINQLL